MILTLHVKAMEIHWHLHLQDSMYPHHLWHSHDNDSLRKRSYSMFPPEFPFEQMIQVHQPAMQ